MRTCSTSSTIVRAIEIEISEDITVSDLILHQLADDIAKLSESHQLCMALALVERLLVAKSLFAEDDQHASINELVSVLDDLWAMITRDVALELDSYDRLSEAINDCRPNASNDSPNFRIRDICWILQRVLRVFRDNEHVFEVSRLTDAIASVSFLNSDTEAHNQRQILDKLASMQSIDRKDMLQIRDLVRLLPIEMGEPNTDHQD